MSDPVECRHKLSADSDSQKWQAEMMLAGLCPAPEPHQKSADLRADLFHHSWFLQGTSPLLRFSRLFALFQVLS